MLQLERRRRLSGKKFTELSAASGISYKRVWGFFTKGTRLRLNEVESLSALLPEDATSAEAPASGNTPNSGNNVGSGPVASDVSNDDTTPREG